MKLRHKRRKIQRYGKFYFSFLNWRKEMHTYLQDAPVNDPPKWIYKGRQIADLNRFINGECVNFALALAKKWKLTSYIAMHARDDGNVGIGHAFCYVGKDHDGTTFVIDAKGLRKMSSALEDFPDLTLDSIVELDDAFLKEWTCHFKKTRSAINRQTTIRQRLNKIASYYINKLFSGVRKDYLDFVKNQKEV